MKNTDRLIIMPIANRPFINHLVQMASRSVFRSSWGCHILMLIFIIGSLAGGCVTGRVIEVNTFRISAEQPGSHGLTPVQALDIFHHVAKQLGYVVEGPIHVSATKFEYVANVPENVPTEDVCLILWVENGYISFLSRTGGTPGNLAAAQRTTELFKQSLDKKGIQYRVTTRTENPLN